MNQRPGLVERNFIYAADVTVPPGGGLVKMSLQLSSAVFAAQFSFVVRAVEAYTAAPEVDGESVFFQLRRYDGSFIDNAPSRLKTILNPRYPTDFPSRWPGELYPATSVIEVDFYNEGAGSATVTLYFLGVHLVPANFETPYSFPRRYTEQPFDYVTTEIFAAGQLTADNRVLHIQADADFCLLGAVGSFEPNYSEPVDLKVRMKSSNGVPYSNVPIRWEFFVGLLTAEKPRFFWPPLFIPKNSYLLLDWVRS